MSQLGIGAMLGMLGGNEESVSAFTGAIGKEILTLSVEDDQLLISLTDGSKIKFTDEGQSCCEHRHMSTDDDLSYYIGAKLTGGECKPGPEAEGEYGECHDQEFLEVMTDKGSFTVVNHNEHNGYYGGFCIRVSTAL